MKRRLIKEDNLSSNLPVHFSSKITKEINAISVYNQNNIEGISQWSDYLDGVRSYMSKSVIAWDYTNRYPRLRNGGRFIKDFDYNVGYTIINDNTTGLPFVFVFMMNLKPEEFGLKVPQPLGESYKNKPSKRVYRLTESQLHTIIGEVIKEFLLSA